MRNPSKIGNTKENDKEKGEKENYVFRERKKERKE